MPFAAGGGDVFARHCPGVFSMGTSPLRGLFTEVSCYRARKLASNPKPRLRATRREAHGWGSGCLEVARACGRRCRLSFRLRSSPLAPLQPTSALGSLAALELSSPSGHPRVARLRGTRRRRNVLHNNSTGRELSITRPYAPDLPPDAESRARLRTQTPAASGPLAFCFPRANYLSRTLGTYSISRAGRWGRGTACAPVPPLKHLPGTAGTLPARGSTCPPRDLLTPEKDRHSCHWHLSIGPGHKP